MPALRLNPSSSLSCHGGFLSDTNTSGLFGSLTVVVHPLLLNLLSISC